MTVRDIFQAYGMAYLSNYADTIPVNHRKVIHAIMDCLNFNEWELFFAAVLPAVILLRYTNPAVTDTYLPCQGQKAADWLSKRLDRMLPVPHFMITFTIPAQFREFFRSHQSFAYSTLFKSSSFVLKKLASEQTYFDGDIPGFFGVLHTWGRQLQYHPHIHYIVPGGAFSSLDYSFHSSNKSFYLPVKIMSKLVKAYFYKKMKNAGFLNLIPDKAWKQDWNVNSKGFKETEQEVLSILPIMFSEQLYRINVS